MPSTVEPHIIYYLAGIVNRVGDLKDHQTVEYTKIPNTPDFTTQASAETFRDDVILANDENKKFYRCASVGGAFSPNHIKVITQTREVILV
jgi:hypothetical protein